MRVIVRTTNRTANIRGLIGPGATAIQITIKKDVSLDEEPNVTPLAGSP
jgi:hypothetical protein